MNKILDNTSSDKRKRLTKLKAKCMKKKDLKKRQMCLKFADKHLNKLEGK